MKHFLMRAQTAIIAMTAIAGSLALVNTSPAAAGSNPACNPVLAVTTEHPSTDWWTSVKTTISGSLANGHQCVAGDSFTVTIPDELASTSGTTFTLGPVANAVVEDKTVTVTFTDYVTSHLDITFSGWLAATLDGSAFTPGETKTLTWVLDGTTTPAPVTAGDCNNCADMPTYPVKWTSLGDDGYVWSGVRTPTFTQHDVKASMEDVLGAGQACEEVFINIVTGLDANGAQKISYGGQGHCDPANPSRAYALESDLVQPLYAGTYVEWVIKAKATDATLTSYSDEATINLSTSPTPIKLTAETAAISGGGTGTGVVVNEATQAPAVAPIVAAAANGSSASVSAAATPANTAVVADGTMLAETGSPLPVFAALGAILTLTGAGLVVRQLRS